METRIYQNIIIIDLPVRMNNSVDFTSALFNILENSTNHIILNFAQVDYVNSSFVSAIIQAMRFLEGTDRKIKLCSINKRIREILSIVNLDKSLDIVPDEDDATWEILQNQEDPASIQ